MTLLWRWKSRVLVLACLVLCGLLGATHAPPDPVRAQEPPGGSPGSGGLLDHRA